MEARESKDRGLSRRGFNVHVFMFNNNKFRDCYGIVPYVREPEICYEGAPHALLAVEPRSPGGRRPYLGSTATGIGSLSLGSPARKSWRPRGG